MAGLLTPEQAEQLRNGGLLTRLGMGAYDAGQGLLNYQYPNDALGWAALPAKAVAAVGGGLIDQIQGAMNEAPGAVMGLNDGSQNTDLAMGLLGTNAVMPFRAPAGSLPAHVWQGSPHKYGPEGAKESLKHIGKGEGAQAYGWGRYDAGARDVGEQYMRGLSDTQVKVGGETIIAKPRQSWAGKLSDAVLARLPDDMKVNAPIYRSNLQRAVERQQVEGGDLDKLVFSEIDGEIQKLRSELSDMTGPRSTERQKRLILEMEAERDALVKAVSEADISVRSTGNLYKHDLPDEDIARYLDWDNPLSEQGEVGERMIQAIKSAERPSPAQSVADRALLDELGVELADFAGAPDPTPNLTGAQAYNTLQELMGGRGSVFDKEMPAQKAASEALARAGIPGLKYLDGMSRREGAGSHNYVTWDQDVLNRMKLLERNGQPMGLLDAAE